MKKLPIGIQDFEKLIDKDCVYIDKTEYIHRLLESGGETFFLSRPRRFGKSLLLSTIKSVMEGRRELFEGTYIHDKVDWEPYPVILLDMGGLSSISVEVFTQSLIEDLQLLADMHDIALPDRVPNNMLIRIVYELRQKTGRQVVLLVDEYDHPILDAMNKPVQAEQMRDLLRSFYGTIKRISGNLRMVFLTGVSKLSQVSIFSGLNNLYDLTMDKGYAGICGYTQLELEDSFDEHIGLLAELGNMSKEQTIEKIRHWYNGYSWDGKSTVYNPYSTLTMFQRKEFLSYWFSTGTTTFLLKLMQERNDLSPVLEEDIVQPAGFTDGQSLEHLDLVPLLFQTGYLTVKQIDEDGRYHLGAPNYEVKQALGQSLLGYITGGGTKIQLLTGQLGDDLSSGNIEGAVETLQTLLAAIPYTIHIPHEGYYHSMFLLILKMAGLDHHAEVMTDKGRIDSVIKFPGRTYITELKYSPDENGLEQALNKALNQIKDKGYYEQYRETGKTLHLLALAITRGKIMHKLENRD